PAPARAHTRRGPPREMRGGALSRRVGRADRGPAAPPPAAAAAPPPRTRREMLSGGRFRMGIGAELGPDAIHPAEVREVPTCVADGRIGRRETDPIRALEILAGGQLGAAPAEGSAIRIAG